MKVKDKTVTEHQHNYANYANIMLNVQKISAQKIILEK